MADTDKGDEVTGETTSALSRADFLNELEAVPTVGPIAAPQWLRGWRWVRQLVVKRGSNAGSRFLLDRPVTWRADIPAVMCFSTTSR